MSEQEPTPSTVASETSTASNGSLVPIDGPGVMPTGVNVATDPSSPTNTESFNQNPLSPAAASPSSTVAGNTHGGLSDSAKAGIAVGVIMFAALTLGPVALLWRKRRRSRLGRSRELEIPEIGGQERKELEDTEEGEAPPRPRPLQGTI